MPYPELSRRRFVRVASTAIVGASLGGTSVLAGTGRDRAPSGRHFVLVHGAWHGAWCWYKVVSALESIGYAVTAPDLPSAGIDATPPATVGLRAQADRVIALLDTLPEPVILVGHSAGGAVVSVVAEVRPDRIEKLVYLTAFLLPSGSSLGAVALQDTGSLLPGHLTFAPDGTIDVERSARREVFYGECNDRDVALAQLLLKPIGLQATLDPVVVGAGFERVRRFYISCLRDRAISPALQRSMYTALPCEQVLEIRSDHSPFLSHPAALLRSFAAIARA